MPYKFGCVGTSNVYMPIQSNLYTIRIDFANLDSSRGTQKRPEGSFISNTSMLAERYYDVAREPFEIIIRQPQKGQNAMHARVFMMWRGGGRN
jgi:hypothetical protein